MSVRYRLLLIVILIPITVLFIWQAIRQREWRFLMERGGFIKTSLKEPLWFHAASVGEVNAVAPLINYFQQQHEQPLLITTTTPTGAATARRLLPDVEHHYFPFDYLIHIKRAFRGISPKAIIIVETEIWPNLFNEAKQQHIPLVIINGRLSTRSTGASTWVKQLYRQTLARVDHIYCRSDDDKAQFERMGATVEQLTVTGNLKYGAINNQQAEPLPEITRPYLLAASTRDEEEPIIASAFKQANLDNTLLVIAPRHPERIDEIEKSLREYQLAVRSRGEAINDTTEIYIADTIGEMASLIAGSVLVIMGGSFVNKGGQNLLEPAAAGKATIVGPYMDNFKEETRELLVADGVIQTDAKALAEKIQALFDSKETAQKIGTNALAFIAQKQQVVSDYYQQLQRYL